jgi:hypothetical protein
MLVQVFPAIGPRQSHPVTAATLVVAYKTPNNYAIQRMYGGEEEGGKIWTNKVQQSTPAVVLKIYAEKTLTN